MSGSGFTIDGRKISDGRRWRDADISGLLFGAAIPDTADTDPRTCGHLRSHGIAAVWAQCNRSSEENGQPSPFSDQGDLTDAPRQRLASLIDVTAEAGLVLLLRAVTPRDIRALIQTHARQHAVQSVVRAVLASGRRHIAVIIDDEEPHWVHARHRLVTSPAHEIDLVATARTADPERRILVGHVRSHNDTAFRRETAPSETPRGDQARPTEDVADFIVRRAGRDQDVQWPEQRGPEIIFGRCDDLGSPQGRVARAVMSGRSWVARSRNDTLNPVFLETVRSITGTGDRPTDDATVNLSDQRSLFAHHARAVRAIGLLPADTVAGPAH